VDDIVKSMPKTEFKTNNYTISATVRDIQIIIWRQAEPKKGRSDIHTVLFNFTEQVSE
jgi:hypothetical protein